MSQHQGYALLLSLYMHNSSVLLRIYDISCDLVCCREEVAMNPHFRLDFQETQQIEVGCIYLCLWLGTSVKLLNTCDCQKE